MNRAQCTYFGARVDGDAVVTVAEGAVTVKLPPRLDLVNHSPTGLNWGYSGSGPAQLALAMLAWHLNADNTKTGGEGGMMAVQLHQHFKFDRIAKLDMDRGWTFRAFEIESWLASVPELVDGARDRVKELQEIARLDAEAEAAEHPTE